MQSLISFGLCLFFVLSSFAVPIREPKWGQTGHRTIGEIATDHLTNRARKKIEKLLDGHNLAYVSTFGDEIKSDKRYDKYYTWHYVNFPIGSRYEDSNKEEKGDIMTGMEHCISVLKDENASREDQVFHLKLLVHLIGDLHQPLHVGRAEDRGGNDIEVSWHYKKSNLHRVWDTQMIESWNMSYTELEQNMGQLSKEQIRSIENGSLLDWMYDSRELAERVYASASPDDKLGYRYSYDHLGTVMAQLRKGGIRLAKVLNEIYS